MNTNNKQKTFGKFFIFFLLCATLAHAQGPEQTWLKGARTMDGVKATQIAINLPVQPLLITPAMPAGIPIGQPSYRGETKTQVLTLRTNQNDFTVPMEVNVYRVWTELVPVLREYDDYDCKESQGNGREGDWRGFFNAPRGQKPQALADAIKGIGPRTAECIVDNNILSSKPRSWGAFKNKMREASDVCDKSIYGHVIVQYGSENSQNLGYRGNQECTVTRRQDIVLEEQERREINHTVRREFHVHAQGGQYLPSESETIEFSYDGLSEPKIETGGDAWRGGLNQYLIQKRSDSDYVLVGNGRFPVKPNNSISIEFLNLPQYGSVVRVTDLDYVAGLDNPQAQTFVTIVAKKNRFGPDKTLRESRVLLQNGKADKSLASLLGPDVKPGDKYYFEYRLERQNSRFNNTSKSEEKETAKQIQ